MDNDFLSGLSEEQLAQLMGLGTMDEKSGILQDQIAQAMAMRQPVSGQHGTGMGAALGGLGDVLGGIGGGIQMKGLRADQQKLLADKNAARNIFGGLMRGKGGAAQSTPDAPFGFGYSAGSN